MTGVTVRGTMADLVDSDLPAWIRVGCVAWRHADATGHARLTAGQLARELALTTKQASAALAIAKTNGWVDPISNARCLTLPGCSGYPCEEHR